MSDGGGVFRSLSSRDELALLVSRSPDPAAAERWVGGLLDRGQARLEWCRIAMDGRTVLAAHAFDSWTPGRPSQRRPGFVTLLGHGEASVATRMLSFDLRLFGAEDVMANVSVRADAPEADRTLSAEQQVVLRDAGFGREVERVSLEWRAGSPPTAKVDGVTFEPAAGVADRDLVEIFASVGDGSLDHSMVAGRAERGRRQEATSRLRAARARQHEPDWFVVASRASGARVGYVQGALVNGRPILAEVGVVEQQRGNRYVDVLLAYATSRLAASGATAVRAHTDSANTPMRNAFRRCGYAETGARVDFRWVADEQPSQGGTDRRPWRADA